MNFISKHGSYLVKLMLVILLVNLVMNDAPLYSIILISVLLLVILVRTVLVAARRHNLDATKDWAENTGTQPPLFNVDIVHSNGRISRYTPAKKHDWSLKKRNPIIRFRKHDEE